MQPYLHRVPAMVAAAVPSGAPSGHGWSVPRNAERWEGGQSCPEQLRPMVVGLGPGCHPSPPASACPWPPAAPVQGLPQVSGLSAPPPSDLTLWGGAHTWPRPRDRWRGRGVTRVCRTCLPGSREWGRPCRAGGPSVAVPAPWAAIFPPAPGPPPAGRSFCRKGLGQGSTEA